MIYVYYHKNCFDGICSAWVAHRYFGSKAKYIPINYGEQHHINNFIQDCYENANINDEIYFIDFSIKREVLDMLYNKVVKLVVLDHHKTAEVELKDAPYAIFDMNESGASLAWKYFFPKDPMPNLVKYIKDRDLWKFIEVSSREVNAYIQSFEMTIENQEKLYKELFDIDLAENAGQALLRYQNKLVNDMCKNTITRNIGGYHVPVTNASVLFSEVGNALCLHDENLSNRGLFSAYYFDRADGKRQWGLRSIGDFDVSLIAKKYGGGGHKNAAGFITDLNWLGD